MPTPAPAQALPALTQPDVIALAAIVQAAHAGVRIERLMPDDHPAAGQVVDGIARHIVTDERALFPGGDEDIRACMLRVTGGLGDYFWPVTDLVDAYHAGALRINGH